MTPITLTLISAIACIGVALYFVLLDEYRRANRTGQYAPPRRLPVEAEPETRISIESYKVWIEPHTKFDCNSYSVFIDTFQGHVDQYDMQGDAIEAIKLVREYHALGNWIDTANYREFPNLEDAGFAIQIEPDWIDGVPSYRVTVETPELERSVSSITGSSFLDAIKVATEIVNELTANPCITDAYSNRKHADDLDDLSRTIVVVLEPDNDGTTHATMFENGNVISNQTFPKPYTDITSFKLIQ